MANKNFQNYAVAGNNVALTYDNVNDTVTFDVNVDKTDIGLGNVDNTSDINKPISTLVQNALNLKQDAITLTTTGSSGASTFAANVLNIPTYTLSGLGGQPLATNLTSISALTFASTSFVKMTAAGTFALDTNTYLTAETDTLASVTGRGNSTTNAITVGGLVVATNLIYTDTVNGRVGIGTSSPQYKLDVQGTTLATSTISTQGAFNINPLAAAPVIGGFTLSAGTNLGVGQYYYFVVYVTALGETNASPNLSVVTTAGNTTVNLTGIPISTDPRVTARKLYRTKLGGSTDNQFFLATISNNVTTTYTDSATDASLTGVGLQSYKVNTTARYFTVSGTQAMVIDGNLTAFGRNAGNAIITSNATAVRTVLIGAQAGQNITTGTANVIVGVAGVNLTTGGNNTLVGDSAGYGLTTGYDNTILGGDGAGRWLTTSTQNVIIGAQAARNLADGTTQFTGGSNNTVIGVRARMLTISDTNAIIIGHTALGLGTNTTVIGNSSTTFSSIPAGNFAIGTTTNAGFRLDVNGTARIQNQLTTTGSITAASAIARGVYMNQTLVAAANNDVLVGLDIQPTFTTGAFTGITTFGVYSRANIGTVPNTFINMGFGGTGATSEKVLFGNERSYVGFDATIGGTIIGAISTRTVSIGLGGQSSMTTYARFHSTTGNLTLQNGGTFTDSGYRLDVVGADSRFNGIRAGLGAGQVVGNTVFGFGALNSNSTGIRNTAIGYEALNVSTGNNNTAVGYQTLKTNTGANNTAIGSQALRDATGGNNTAIGYQSLLTHTTGTNNTAIGYQTASGNFSGSVILGQGATATANNQFVVGSSTVNAGTVNIEAALQTRVWNVLINGTAYKILLAI